MVLHVNKTNFNIFVCFYVQFCLNIKVDKWFVNRIVYKLYKSWKKFTCIDNTENGTQNMHENLLLLPFSLSVSGEESERSTID